MAVFKGDASLLIQAGLGNDRRYSLRTSNVTGAPADRATWEGNAGTSVTLFFRNETTGAAPPSDPDGAGADTFELRVYYETGTGTLVRTLHSAGTPPADGTSYTFHFTSDGTSGGTPRCGQLRLYIRALFDGVANDYDRNSDNTGGSGLAGVGDQGVLRSNMLVSDLTVSAYPAGSKFAFGAAANEQFTLTATHTQRYADTNNETFDFVSLSAADSAVETFADVEVGATTTTSQAFTVDDTYATGDNNYGFQFTVNNNGLLRTNEKWTLPVDNGANVTQDGTNSVKRSSFYVVNPDVTLGAPTLSRALHNRGDTGTVSLGITNARSEAVTRSLSFQIKDSDGTVKKSFTDTGVTYGDGGASDYVIGATDKATYDLVGDQWTINLNTSGARATNTRTVYRVSRKWQVSTSNSSVNNAIFVGKAASPTSDTGAIRNRGQPVFFNCYVYNANSELLGNVAGFFNVRPIDNQTYEESSTGFTLASGQMTGASATYTVDTDEATGFKALVFGSSAATGTNQPRDGTAGNGNFAESDINTGAWQVSSSYVAQVRTQKESSRNEEAQDLVFTIATSTNYAFVKILDQTGDAVSGVDIRFDQLDPDGVVSDTKTATTEADGWTPAVRFRVDPPESAEWAIQGTVDPTHTGNGGTDSQTVSYVSPFDGNKTAIVDLGPVATVPNLNPDIPTAREGDIAMPGDRILLGFGLAVRDPETGVTQRVEIPVTPRYALIYFDQDIAGGGASAGAYVLQDDHQTWKKNTDVGYSFHFREFKYQGDSNMAWLAHHGHAAQGVTSGIGYPTAAGTSGWPRRRIYMLVELEYNGALFLLSTKVDFGFRGSLRVQETDGGPDLSILRLKLPNGTLTQNSTDVITMDITHDHDDAQTWDQGIERPD